MREGGWMGLGDIDVRGESKGLVHFVCSTVVNEVGKEVQIK